MANSFKQMIKAGVITRNDSGMFISIDDIHIKEGFNPRDYNSEECRAADEELLNHLMAGGSVPPLEVKAHEPDGVWIVEGHRRYRQYLRCREAGLPINRIHILQFKGSDVEAQAHVMKSNNQLKLSPLEKAINLKRLAAFSLTTAEIAALVSMSAATIEKLLALSETDHAVQQIVKAGAVSVDVALDRVEEFGSRAAEVLVKDKEKAAAAGKKKVTRSVLNPEISVKKARRMVALISDALGEDEELEFGADKWAELTEIVNEHRELNKTQDSAV